MTNDPTITSQPTETGFLAGLLKYLPIIQWVLTIICAVSIYALAQRESQTIQAQEMRQTTERVKTLEGKFQQSEIDTERRFSELKREMMTKELFEEFRRGDTETKQRIEKTLQIILEKQSRR